MQSTPPNSALTLESLLAHADWVRALARTLVADPASADDVEQEVWRAALENPPREVSNPRGWLASVARNAARSLGRAGARREQRERGSAKPEALPATSELVAEAELARELAGEVLALEEPYRTVLLLRYWRALSPDEIASAQSISRETVRTQLKRGLERLRERLDRRFGDREQWLAALAPLAKEVHLVLGSATSAVGGGMLVLGLKIAAAATLAASAWWAWPRSVEHASEQVRVEQAQRAMPTPLEVADNVQAPRVPAETSAARASTPATVRAGDQKLSGHLVDLEGIPIAGLELEWQRDTRMNWPPGTALSGPRVFSQGDGRFAVEVAGDLWVARPVDPHRVVVAERSKPGQADWQLTIASCISLSGRVIDESGAPIAGAQVHAESFMSRPVVTRAESETNLRRWFQSTTSPDGRFSFDRVPTGKNALIVVDARGTAGAVRQMPSIDTQDLLITLKPSGRPHLSGVVLDHRGQPAAKAWVKLGFDDCETDERGHFDLALSIPQEGDPLFATLSGAQPAVIEDFGREHMTSKTDLVLQLGPPALSIDGQVLRVDGAPAVNCHVQIVDGFPVPNMPFHVEDAADGRRASGVKTDEMGRFRIGGLSPRGYRLLVWSEATGQVLITDAIRAGSQSLVLRERASDFIEKLAGLAVTRFGEPVAGATVGVALPIWKLKESMNSRRFGKTVTDADGQFLLEHVPASWSLLDISGPGVKYFNQPVPSVADGSITITVVCEVEVRLDLVDPRVDNVKFLDKDGTPTRVELHSLDSGWVFDAIVKRDTGFPIFTLTDDAVTAVLYQGKTEVRRVPIEVRREKLLTLHL